MITERLKKASIAYGILILGGFLLTFLFIKFLYANNLADGICWTTDCEEVSLLHLYLTYGVLLFANTIVFLLVVLAKHPKFYTLVLVFTLIVQCGGFGLLQLPDGHNYMAIAIFYGFAGIITYEYVSHKQKLGAWRILAAEIIIFMIFGMSYMYAEEILIGSGGVHFNPDDEFVISKVINYTFIALIVFQIGYTIDRNKTNQLSWK